jgi:S1-C subfamily serine protease
MKKAVYVCGIIVLLGTIALVYQTRLAAQDRNWIGRQGLPLALVGPGSSIGITVRDSDSGVVIQDVREESPASRAGVQEGDVVTEFDGERTRSAAQLTRVVRETAPGRTVKMTVLRNGTPTTVDVAPELRRADDIRLPNLARDLERRLQVLPRDFNFDFAEPGFSWYSPRRLGVTISPLSDQLASYFGVTGGALVSEVAAGSAGEKAGFKAGDVITMVRGQAVASSADVLRELREVASGTAVEIRVMRDRKEVTLTAMMPERPERIRAFTRRGGQSI